MKTLIEIYKYLDDISPFESQELWDNSGILIGKNDKKISDIFLSLEATIEIAESLPKDSLLITHHPLIFKPLKNLRTDFYPNNIIEILMQKNIALIAMHTNFDLSHLNKSFVCDVLGFKQYEKENFIIKVAFNASFAELISLIEGKMPNANLKITQASETIKNLIIVCGAGCGVIAEENVGENDCIITGDVKYHDAMKFLSLKVSIIDVGHYHSERHFGDILQKNLKKIGYKAIILTSQNPFS